ncbi:MAG: hypothetical protein JXR76_16665 [Deltaproteobacteria bacterium]|nr:hypothetical protein [Deltaproteobacteria bacterium]
MKKTHAFIVGAGIAVALAVVAILHGLNKNETPESVVNETNDTNDDFKEWGDFSRFIKTNGEVLKDCDFSPHIWKQNARQMYRFKVWNGLNVQGAGTTEDLIDMEGTLNFRVLKVDDNDVIYVGMQVSPITVTMGGKRRDVLESLFQTFFIVTFSKYGDILHIALPPGLEGQDAVSLKEMFNALKLIVPPQVKSKNDMTWTVDEQNSLGQYNARYEFEPSDCLYSKTKTKFVKLANVPIDPQTGSPVNLTAKILDSTLTAQLSSGVSWITRIKGTERIQLYQDKRLLSDVESRLFLELLSFNPDKTLAIWDDTINDLKTASTIMARQRLIGNRNTWDKMNQKRLQEQYESVNIADTLAVLNKRITEDSPHSDVLAAVKDLMQHLKAYPERALKLPALMANMSEASVRPVFSALETAGHEQAQQALSQIMTGYGQNDYNRLHAIISTGGIATPGEPLVDSLMNVVDDRASGTESEVERGNTALLSLGTLGDSLGDQNEALSGKIEERIQDELQNAKTDEEKTVAIKAMSNLDAMESEADFEKLSAFLKDDDVEVRRAALEALKRAPANYKFENAYAFFSTSEDSRLRVAAFNLLASVTEPKLIERVIDVSISKLSVEPNIHLRTMMVEYLGALKKADNRIVPTLEAQLELETTRIMAQSILRAIYE